MLEIHVPILQAGTSDATKAASILCCTPSIPLNIPGMGALKRDQAPAPPCPMLGQCGLPRWTQYKSNEARTS